MAVELPLFPLHTVLFPHMPLGLHVFEDRYRAMMRDCRERGTTFGVLAIREGAEVGGRALPYTVGTLAQLRDVEELPDGRYNLLVVGASRFHVDSFVFDRPYLVGAVRYLQDSAGAPDDTEMLAGQVRVAFQNYITSMAHVAGKEATDVALPDDPELLAYLVGGALEVEIARKQQLLEHDSTADRLRGCLEALRREAVFVERLSTRRHATRPHVSLN